ncbi:hypothetical protein PYW07_002507 [Mythimna separata]|uniref:Lysosomal-trafficking regulator n=1 Tax=Mythimna separata TaxID=271217 RepID=A0AAD8DT47_MYTSE|nr:hypothetical protein PYW07_002507 [Mythimna separata]
MAAEEDIDTLKLYWDHFFKAETGTYEKSTWLDLFLAEFLIRVNDGANPKELIKFCPVSGVVTLVGCELLCGIHRVTSSINTHYSVPLPLPLQYDAPSLDALPQVETHLDGGTWTLCRRWRPTWMAAVSILIIINTHYSVPLPLPLQYDAPSLDALPQVETHLDGGTWTLCRRWRPTWMAAVSILIIINTHYSVPLPLPLQYDAPSLDALPQVETHLDGGTWTLCRRWRPTWMAAVSILIIINTHYSVPLPLPLQYDAPSLDALPQVETHLDGGTWTLCRRWRPTWMAAVSILIIINTHYSVPLLLLLPLQYDAPSLDALPQVETHLDGGTWTLCRRWRPTWMAAVSILIIINTHYSVPLLLLLPLQYDAPSLDALPQVETHLDGGTWTLCRRWRPTWMAAVSILIIINTHYSVPLPLPLQYDAPSLDALPQVETHLDGGTWTLCRRWRPTWMAAVSILIIINTHYSVPLPLPLQYDAPSLDALPQVETHLDGGIADTEQKPEEQKAGPTSLFTRINTQSSEQILRKYLLGGVAWRCLVLLKALGVEGLSCCRQLSSVLIWLFGELSGASTNTTTEATKSPTTPRTPIHQLFSHRIWSKQKPIGGQTSKVHSAASSERGSVTGRSRHSTQPKFDSLERTKKRLSKQHTDQSSESGDSNDDLQILNRSLTIKVCTPNDDFEYFNSTRSSNEYPNDSYYDPFYTPRKTKPKADDYINDKHREIINSEITTFQFTLIITDLLQELCKAESSLSGSEGSQISMQCINFSLRNLCSLQFSSVPTSQQDNTQEVSRIKVALTELLMVSLDQVLIHSDLCAKLINNGILPMLLRILEDVISKCRQNKLEYQTRKEDKTESENLLKFVFGIAYSITAFFHCLLMQCRSVDKLREFTDQFKLYGECLKGGLLKECIELMIRIPAEEEESVVLIKKLIETVGKLVVGMKRVRSEVIHSAACPRTRHKVCRQRVAAGMHHHHDILGEASTGLPMSSACCISVLYGTLTSLLTDEEVSAQSVLRNKILKVMLNCGVCCCFSPGLLMESIVRLMLTHSSVASLCLQVLEHTVYGELGASILIPKVTDQLPCSICEPCDEKREVGRKFCSHGISPIERKSVWSFLYHYNSLLQLDNHNNVLHATVSHLLRVTPKCRMEMKCELLFSVIYPTFIVAKHRYIIRMEESAYFLTVSCLNIFASLLNTISFAEQFIQKGGLSYVLELVSLSEFSNQCCSILEIAIIVEVFKLMKENSELTYFREMNSLASVQMLFKSLTEVTDKCFKIYKLKLPEEKFIELCDISKERDMLAFIHPAELRSNKNSSPQSIKSNFGNEKVVEETIADHIEVLKNVWTFWKTCACLCLHSPMFREYVVSEAVFADGYALLKVLLHYLCNCECGAQEMRVLIKITEALLTVQLSASDVTSGRSKETSCALVRGALGAPAAALEGGGGLRALCEALIRVAAARASSHHAMPRRALLKVPPLLCASGGSSAECSSSEDSVAGPYASEHSEPYASRPDEGYEADVEVGKLDVPPLYRTSKLSGSMSTIPSGISSPPGELSTECGEYTKSGELAHPELCVIVVDILTQLIHKLVRCKEEGDCNGSSWRLGVGVARAWCGRVGAALCRARAAHPPLLKRLLAPQPAQLLAAKDDRLEDLQRSILELIHVLASQSIEPTELAAFLKLFNAEQPPLSMLLSSLHRLVATATYNTPDCILTFPVDTDNTGKCALGAGFLKLFNAEQPPLSMLLSSLHRLVATATYNTPDCILTFPVDTDNTGKCALGAGFLKLFNAEQPPLSMLLSSLHRLVATATYNTPDCILTFPVDTDNTGKCALGAGFLKLFNAEQPPLSMLLSSLHRLVATATYNTPDCILTFPVDTDNTEGIQSLAEELSYLVVNTTTSQSHQAENCAKRFHEAHIRAGIRSPWSCHAVRCGVEGAGWAPWLAGFALSAWIHAQHANTAPHHHWDGIDDFNDEPSDTEASKKKSPKKEAASKPTELSHVLSVGHESLMLEVWLDTNTGMFTFRLSRPEVGLNRIVSEARVQSDMPARQWSCVALNVKELLYKRHIYVQVTVRLKRIVSEARHAGAPVELCRAQCEGAALQETHLRAGNCATEAHRERGATCRRASGAVSRSM